MEMRQISWETYLLCLFSDFVASEKERVRGRSSDSERELSSDRNRWDCKEKMLFVAVWSYRQFKNGKWNSGERRERYGGRLVVGGINS